MAKGSHVVWLQVIFSVLWKKVNSGLKVYENEYVRSWTVPYEQYFIYMVDRQKQDYHWRNNLI